MRIEPVYKFCELADQPINEESVSLYVKLVEEEYKEMTDAEAAKDRVEILDGALDLIWVSSGLFRALGGDAKRIELSLEITRQVVYRIGGYEDVRASSLEEHKRISEAINMSPSDVACWAFMMCDVALLAMFRNGFSVWQSESGWEEVIRSNMSKVDPVTGKMLKNEFGKVIKPPSYSKPDLERILAKVS